MRKDHLPLPSFFRGKLAVKDSGGVNLWSVRKKQKFWKKLQAFCGQTATKKKHPHPPKKFNCSTPQDWASYWWEHLGSLHCAGGTGPFRRVSFGAKVSRFRFVFGRVRTCWWSKKIGAGITNLRAPGVHLHCYCWWFRNLAHQLRLVVKSRDLHVF